MYKLISLYSTLYNAYVPVLHLPLFLAALADGLHLRDPEFGSVLLLVCALGARFSDDPRVLLPEADEEGIAKARWVDSSDDEDSQQDQQTAKGQDSKPRSWHSAGWKWFRQVKIGRRALAVPPSLFDLQVACVCSQCLFSLFSQVNRFTSLRRYTSVDRRRRKRLARSQAWGFALLRTLGHIGRKSMAKYPLKSKSF